MEDNVMLVPNYNKQPTIRRSLETNNPSWSYKSDATLR